MDDSYDRGMDAIKQTLRSIKTTSNMSTFATVSMVRASPGLATLILSSKQIMRKRAIRMRTTITK